MGRSHGEKIAYHIKKGKNMNEIVRKISLDLSRKSNISLMFSSQTDMNSRVFLISLFDDGRPYFISLGTSVAVNVKRSDGTSAAFIAEVTEEGCVKYTAGAWALGMAGETCFSVSLYDGNGQKLTSSCFTVDVAPGLYLGLEVGEDDEEQNIYDSMMNKFAESIAQAENAQKAAEKGAEDAMHAVQYAETYAGKAEAYAQNAQNFAYNAETSERNAWASEEAARGYSENASASAMDANESADAAKESVTDAVHAVQFAEDYARKAEAYAQNAQNFAYNAETSERNAWESEEISKQYSEIAVDAAASAIEAATAQAPGIVNSSSGELISVSDSAERPAVGFKVAGKSVQDGTPTPDAPIAINCVKAGTKIRIHGANLFITAQDEIRDGITFATNADGSVTVSGTATAHALTAQLGVNLPAGIYFASGSENGVSVIVGYRNNDGVQTYASNSSFTLDKPQTVKCYVQVNPGTTVNNVTIYPMLNIGNNAQPYEPYISSGEIVTPCDLYEGDIWYPTSGIVERYTDEIIFTGEEAIWEAGLWYGDVIAVVFSPALSDINSAIRPYCEYFDGRLLSDTAVTNSIFIQAQSAGIAFNGTTAELRTFLTENPVKVIYTRSSPIIEEYEPQAVATLYGKTSVVQFPSELAADIELQYVADTKIYIDNKLAMLQAMILEG